MKKQHPITYEQVGYVLLTILIVFGIIKTIDLWAQGPVKEIEYVGIKTIACYNANGEGPMVTCPAKLTCHTQEHTNSLNSEVPCPIF